MSGFAELMRGSSPRLLAFTTSGDRTDVTFTVSGRRFTLLKDAVAAYWEDLPVLLTHAPPWFEAGWLEREFRHHGSLSAVAEAHGLDASGLRALNHYAVKELGWRVQEGHDIKRWEFYTRFFDLPDADARPPLMALASELGVPKANASLWVKEARAGRFFSKRMSLETLAVMQSGLVDHNYFPGESQQRGVYALLRARGWPTLPRGLLSDLLPLLKNVIFVSAEPRRGLLRFELEHLFRPLVFDLDAPPPPFATDSLRAVEEGPQGALSFVFGEGRLQGTISRVHKADAGPFYILAASVPSWFHLFWPESMGS